MNSDLELEIGAGLEPDSYRVKVVHAAAGGEPTAELHLDVADLLSRRDSLEATVLASAVPARRVMSAAEQPVHQIGKALFESLFTGPVYGTYRASLGAAQQRGKRLRVVLRLTAPELAVLPWETLLDPETETYLCRQEPLVRHVSAPYTPDPLQVQLPLRILGLVASPRGLPVLDVEAEQRHLAEALAGPIEQGRVELTWVPQASWAAVHARLLAGEWHVLHFVGHGDYDTRTEEGLLALVGADGRADLVEASRLADLLGEAQPTPRLVVLNSCSTGQAGTQDLFSGTAAALVHSGISAVAAMQFSVSDTAAIAFARGFYTALAHGRGVDEAARSGRIEILGTRGTLEWITPVLYLRGEASQLFTLTEPPAPRISGGDGAGPPRRATTEPPAATEPPSAHRRAELNALYVEARAEVRLQHYQKAIELLDDLLILDPGHSGAGQLRESAQRSGRLADAYVQARAQEEAGDWAAAGDSYATILAEDRTYRDAATRQKVCEDRIHVADLQSELRLHSAAGNWQQVLDVDAELTALDPATANPDGVATRARLELLYDRGRQLEESGDLISAAFPYREILETDSTFRDAAARLDNCHARDGKTRSLGRSLFLSYARSDEDRLPALLKGLKRLGCHVARDQVGDGGQQWWDSVLEGIRAADSLVLAITPAFLDSTACRRQVEYAEALGKSFLPVILERVSPDLLWPSIVSLRLVNFAGEDERGIFAMVAALDRLPGALPLPDPLPESPPAPVSYVTSLAEQLSKSELTIDEQHELAAKLKAGIQRPGEREAIVRLVRRMRARDDLYAAPAKELDALLLEAKKRQEG